jgi:hypothetical protein
MTTLLWSITTGDHAIFLGDPISWRSPAPLIASSVPRRIVALGRDLDESKVTDYRLVQRPWDDKVGYLRRAGFELKNWPELRLRHQATR